MKVGEDNPQAREEEGKLSLLRLECNSSLAGIPRMQGLEFHGKATAFSIPEYGSHQISLSFWNRVVPGQWK